MALLELYVATVDKRRRPTSRHLLLGSDEQVNGDSPFGMLPNIPAVPILLTGSILALPLELVSVDEMILVLKL